MCEFAYTTLDKLFHHEVEVVWHETESENGDERLTLTPLVRPHELRRPTETFELPFPVIRHPVCMIEIEEIKEESPEIALLLENRHLPYAPVADMCVYARSKLMIASHCSHTPTDGHVVSITDCGH